MKYSLYRLLQSLFWASLWVPRAPFLGVESGLLRLDHLLTLSLGLCSFVVSIRAGKYALFLVSIVLAGLYISPTPTLNTVIGSVYSVLLLYAIIGSFFLGSFHHFNNSNGDAFSSLHQRLLQPWTLIWANIIISIFSIITNLTVCLSVTYGIENSVQDGRCLIDRYGLMGAPYIYSTLLPLSIACIQFTKGNLSLLPPLYFLATGDSRALSVPFIPFYLYTILKSSSIFSLRFHLKTLLGFGLMAAILVVSSIFQFKNISGISQGASLFDHSWQMRLDIYENFRVWLTTTKLLFGDGFQAYFQFATQYGFISRADNLYIRVISETGLVGLLIYLITYLFPEKFSVKSISSHRKPFQQRITRLLFISAVCIAGLGQESLLAVKSAQIMAFSYGLLYKHDATSSTLS
jgi:hypothetical protein